MNDVLQSEPKTGRELLYFQMNGVLQSGPIGSGLLRRKLKRLPRGTNPR